MKSDVRGHAQPKNPGWRWCYKACAQPKNRIHHLNSIPEFSLLANILIRKTISFRRSAIFFSPLIFGSVLQCNRFRGIASNSLECVSSSSIFPHPRLTISPKRSNRGALPLQQIHNGDYKYNFHQRKIHLIIYVMANLLPLPFLFFSFARSGEAMGAKSQSNSGNTQNKLCGNCYN